MKLNVYGRKIEVIRADGAWQAFFIGEGKRRPAVDIIIPADLKENEIPGYLADLLHEWASPASRSKD